MTTTLCGHERAALRLVLHIWSVPGLRMGTVLTTAQQRAYDDVNDPAKLAELMAEELRRRGVKAEACEPLVIFREQPWPMVQVEDPVYMHKLISADMKTSRARLLRLMQLPEGTPVADVLKALEVAP